MSLPSCSSPSLKVEAASSSSVGGGGGEAAATPKTTAAAEGSDVTSSSAAFPPYDVHRNAKRPRSDGEGAGAGAGSDLPFSFQILKHIVDMKTGHHSFYWRNDVVHVMYDAFPKASIHLLVLPVDTSIESLKTVGVIIASSQSHGGDEDDGGRKRMVSLITEMQRVGRLLIAHCEKTLPIGRPLTFQMGFHAVPSIKHLHMHVMSQDFERSSGMKNKKHYQSFASPFFIPCSRVLACLRHSPNPAQELEAMTKAAALLDVKVMKCFWCSAEAKTMPQLLEHLRHCPKNTCSGEPSVVV